MCEPAENVYRLPPDPENDWEEKAQKNRDEIDARLALEQWKVYHRGLENFGCKIHVVKQREPLYDMVHTANWALPYITSYSKKLIISRFRYSGRQGETAVARAEFRELNEKYNLGFEIIDLPEDIILEGVAEVLIIDGKIYGFCAKHKHRRTNPESIEYVARLLGLIPEIVWMEYPFYHRDTCFMPDFDSRTLMYCPEAFNEKMLSTPLFKRYNIFEEYIRVEGKDAENLGCNALMLKEHVLTTIISDKLSSDIEQKMGKINKQFELYEHKKSGAGTQCLINVVQRFYL